MTKLVKIDIKDIGKDKKEILTDLLYETTRSRIPPSKVTYGIPTKADTRPDLKLDHNTFIPLRVSQDYSTLYSGGSSGLLYRRIELADHLKDVGEIELHSLEFPIPLCEILPQINAQLDYPIDCHEIKSYKIAEPGLQEVTLEVVPQSLIWTGSTTITMNVISDALVPLYTVGAIRGFDLYGAGPYTGLQGLEE